MDRRNFLKVSCAACLGSFALMNLLEGCTVSKCVTAAPAGENKICVKKADFILVKKGKTTEQKFVLLKPSNQEFPIALYKLSENEYKAVLLKCTHNGCELTPYETAMVCPCHGAEFNNKGEVTQGPAENNLRSFITTSDNENIYIQLN